MKATVELGQRIYSREAGWQVNEASSYADSLACVAHSSGYPAKESQGGTAKWKAKSDLPDTHLGLLGP